MNPPKPFEMIVDRPFLFVIHHSSAEGAGSILFMGVVFDPSASFQSFRKDREPEATKAALVSRSPAPRYRWLLFDADGTLFDYDRAERAALEQALAQIGVSFEPGHLATYRRINQALWQGVEKGEITPGVVKVRRFELLLEAIQVAHSPAALSASYLECLANCSELVEDAEAVLGALHRKYRIAILTNGLTVVQRGRLARSVIRHHVSDIIISEEIGAAKPAKEFFDTAFARLGQSVQTRGADDRRRLGLGHPGRGPVWHRRLLV